MMMSQPPARKLYNGADPESALLWPYRTTPLVLPGAKVSKDPAPTMSYLRHHPNPMMRSRPAEYEWVPADIAKKQQLADSMVERVVGNDLKSGKKIVTKQFNSPIGLYSDQNIANSVHTHVGGLTPNGGAVNYNPSSRLRKTVHYDPSKSETFKVLQETELGNHVPVEVNIPVTRVFSPVKTPTKHLSPPSTTYNPNRASPQPHPTAPHPKIDYGVPPEEIHQSNSFKRLMNMVMTEY
jgi:hypothetical protein